MSQIYFELASISKNWSSNFEVLLYTKSVCATNTRPFGEVGKSSEFSTALSLTHFAKIDDKNYCERITDGFFFHFV